MVEKVVIAFLGAPGAGKGTQAKILAEKFGFKHLSTGDVLREAVRNGSALGQKVKKVMEAGELVSDDLVSEIVRERLAAPDGSQVLILDGYPRNVNQAKYLDGLSGVRVFVVDIELDEEQAVKRLSGRRFCPECGKIYNVFFSPARREGYCDDCGKGLQQRKDDSEEVIRERFRVYREQTAPVTEYYAGKPNYYEVEGDRDSAQVAAEMSSLIEGLKLG